MVKRYYAGLISSTKRTTSFGNFVSGIYNKNIHLQTTFADAFPPYDLRDTYFKYTTLLLNGNPPSPTFVTDASTNSFPISVVGDTKPNNFNPHSAGYYSNYFDGTGDYLSSSITSIGTNDFTVEYYSYLTAHSGLNGEGGYFEISSVSGGLTTPYTNGIIAYRSNPGSGRVLGIVIGSTSILTTYVVPLNEWFHTAIVRQSGSVRIYVNGILVSTPTSVAGGMTGTFLAIGGYESTSYLMTGYVSNFRVVNGTAVYTGNFTPPAAPLTIAGSTSAASYSNTANVNITFPQANTSVLTCFGNRLKDDSTNNFTITKNGDTKVNAFHPFVSPYGSYASTYFDGTGDYLTALSNAAFTFGTGDFTIEGWFYVNSFGANGFIPFDNRASSSAVPFNIGVFATGYPYLYEGATAPTGSSGITLNTWGHIAWVRTSGVLKMFVNGVSVYSAAYTTNLTGTNCTIGGGVGALAGYFLNGYMSDFRLVKGTAVYTGNFTPPTAPLTIAGSTSAASYSSTANVNITFPAANTSLLTCQNLQPTNNSMFLDKSNNSFVITRNGNSTQGTFSPYGSTWSNYFGSSSNYLTLPTATATAWGGFNNRITTIEFWAYLTTSATAQGSTGWAIGTAAGVVSDGRWFVTIGGGAASVGAPSKVYWYWTIGSTVGTFVEASQAVPINQWTHIAIVTNATASAGSHTVTIYVDGVGQTFTGLNFSSQTFTYDRLRIGGDNDSFPGWIHGLRIVRAPTNIVGYSGSTITVPTAPVGVVANTLLLTCTTNGFKDLSNVTATIGSSGVPLVQKFNPYTPIFDSSLNPKLNNAYTPSINGGSAYFDGTGDYLTFPITASNQFGTGNFTIEFWSYFISRGVNGAGFITNYDVYQSSSFGIFAGHVSADTTKYQVAYDGGAFPAISSTETIKYNQWAHIAAVRNGTTITLYINGVANGTLTSASATLNGSGSTGWCIGAAGDAIANYSSTGYISDLRIIKGTAVYTGNFTPPTRTLLPSGTSATYSNTANVNTTFSVGNTALLCNFTDAAIYDATMNVNLETLGDARVSTANSKFGGSSMFFDGTGDYLTIPSNPVLAIGQKSATVEFWIYPTDTSGYRRIVSATAGVFTTDTFCIRFNNGTFLAGSSGGNNITTASMPITANQWTHVAWVGVNGATQTLYINGSSVGTSTTYNLTTPIQWVGGLYTGPSELVIGYIDDLRITHNARYTANFTPPTASFRLK